ncbi:MAG: methyltransferase, partial [Clostridia bacterium]|nr:methyltransferase [Clostridia bacterium]
MLRLLDLQKQLILSHLGAGDVAVDFTMGNGHDTEFLSKTVGEKGHVYAFDIQAAALESTRENLRAALCPENYTLIH